MIFFAKGLPPVSINFACFIILRFFTDSAPFRTRSLILWLPSPSNTWCSSRVTREHFACKRNCQPLILVSTHFIDFPSCVRAESVQSCSGNHTAGHSAKCKCTENWDIRQPAESCVYCLIMCQFHDLKYDWRILALRRHYWCTFASVPRLKSTWKVSTEDTADWLHSSV